MIMKIIYKEKGIYIMKNLLELKKLSDLKEGDVVYLYGIKQLGTHESVVKIKVVVKYYYNKFNEVIAVEKNVIRYRLKADEGILFRNLLWLSTEDDELAAELLTVAYSNEINKLEAKIKLNKERITKILQFLNKDDN
jgi:hypothetical protein